MKVEPAPNPIVTIGQTRFGNALPLTLIAGPCALESRAHALEMARGLKELAEHLGIGLVYKTSFDKANRTSGTECARHRARMGAADLCRNPRERRRPGADRRARTGAVRARRRSCVDVLQIPAFLCRQTDLLVAAAQTGRVVNVKKGQFLAPWDMANVVQKITGAGNRNVLVTERGASFGYNTLVSDMRALPILARETGAPVIFDATHSVQQPGGQGTSSGGQREFVPVLARAAVAVGVAGVFIETHQDPDKAPSDGPNMIALKDMERALAHAAGVRQHFKTASVSSDDRSGGQMVLQSLAGLPAFLLYFCISTVAVIAFLWIYTRITAHDEFDLLNKNVPGAAVSLGLSMLGFALAGGERRGARLRCARLRHLERDRAVRAGHRLLRRAHCGAEPVAAHRGGRPGARDLAGAGLGDRGPSERGLDDVVRPR